MVNVEAIPPHAFRLTRQAPLTIIRRAHLHGPSWVAPRPGRRGDLLAEVIVGQSENFEAALRRFTKRVQQDGILAEARRREHFEKPSGRRKKKEVAKLRKSRK